MSSNFAIKVENLSKSYQIYEKPHDRLKQSILPRLIQLFGKGTKQYFREFQALKDVSFEVRRGETVGIIGRNGSGKSTLLQMICGTLNPTQGNIQVNGRVAALLELGAGFNPEFTGRENIFTNGALLGLSKDEIEKKFDAILAFADIGLFIDQPVKTYSSGMFVRLAFSIAANLEPDVLIIDEALAVGDMAFQAKCMARIRALMDRGTTILFVSHDLASVRNICQRVLWLRDGSAIEFGAAPKVVDAYVRDMHMQINKNLITAEESVNFQSADKNYHQKANDLSLTHSQANFTAFSEAYKQYGNGKVSILDAVILNSSGELCELLGLLEPFKIQIIIRANKDVENPVIGFGFMDLKGNQVIGMQTTNYQSLIVPSFTAGQVYRVEIDGINKLTQGVYSLLVAVENCVHKNIAHEYLDVVEAAKIFKSNFGISSHNIIHGMVWDAVDIKIDAISLLN